MATFDGNEMTDIAYTAGFVAIASNQIVTPDNTANVLMRALNSLGATVFWYATTIDGTGAQYSGGNLPLTQIVYLTDNN